MDVKGIKHAGIEALEKFGDGYCLKIKLKEHALFKIDIFVVCLENEDLRDMWIKKFSAVKLFYYREKKSDFPCSLFPGHHQSAWPFR